MSYKTKALGRSDTGQKKQLRAEVLQSPLCVFRAARSSAWIGELGGYGETELIGANSTGPENVGLYEFGLDPEKKTDDMDQEP